MKKSVLLFLLLLSEQRIILLAQTPAPSHMVRIYEDNDFINIRGKGTDRAYTNGTRFDYFYTPKKQPQFIVNRLLPKAGEGSVNTYSWSLMQLMFTPNNITTKYYQPNDYPYSGALLASHTLYSFNPIKKLDVQTEVMAGIQGPASLTKQTQKLLHHIIDYQQPMGWSNESKSRMLANVNVTVEKQLAAYKKSIEVIGSGQLTAGNMVNSITLSPQVRIGKMEPYFNGALSQYSASKQDHHIQCYFVLKPAARLVLSNTLLTEKPASPVLPAGDRSETNNKLRNEDRDVKTLVYTFAGSAVVAMGKFCISFTQNVSSPVLKHLYSHAFGNLSLHYSW